MTNDASVTLRDLLDLEAIELNLFRSNVVFDDPYALYGGQVAAQALRAAAATVEPGRPPHSLHGYFLRAGNASIPTVFQVFRDRDGRSFTARRVVAVQRGEVIFNMSVSFHAVGTDFDAQHSAMPDVPSPDSCPPFDIPRLFSYEGRSVSSPYADAEWPMRFWARCDIDFDDPVLDACALTYLSDISSGLAPYNNDEYAASSSLDHSLWFHRPARSSSWILQDLLPQTVSGGRGWYTGSLYDESGRLVASIAQETLFRRRRR